MTGAIVCLATVMLIVVMCLAMTGWRHRRPAELRGDWWPDFEREFRAYAREARPPRGR